MLKNEEVKAFEVVESILLTRREFSICKAISSVKRRESGAVVSFLGTVRSYTGGRKVKKLEFEADKEEAIRKLNELRIIAMRRYKLQDVTIIHRIGTLKVSENIVLISVSAPHRDKAFAACRYVLEELKRSVPIWKKEYTEKGASWVQERKPAKR